MSSNAGLCPLAVDRWTPFVRILTFKGVNLTGATLHAQVRVTADAPGDPLIDLPPTSTPGVEGIRLVSVDTTGVVPVSTVEMRIAAASLANSAKAPSAPPSATGSDVTLAWDLHVTPSGGDKQRWLYGPFVIVAGVTR
ncbi:hypothetical protein [Sphingomonas sp. MMS24-J13]|uniref:hypothetical protein n=1 Tax=Sphingomonas sp. MMS24-J13 TaxID=3238686 RepID=UPI00384BF215